jgi:hypothetical protein
MIEEHVLEQLGEFGVGINALAIVELGEQLDPGENYFRFAVRLNSLNASASARAPSGPKRAPARPGL